MANLEDFITPPANKRRSKASYRQRFRKALDMSPETPRGSSVNEPRDTPDDWSTYHRRNIVQSFNAHELGRDTPPPPPPPRRPANEVVLHHEPDPFDWGYLYGVFVFLAFFGILIWVMLNKKITIDMDIDDLDFL